MMSVKAASDALYAALQTVATVHAYRDPGATIEPPGAVLGPPALQWEGIGREPTSATFIVSVVTSADGRAVERLWDLVPLIAGALDRLPDAAVIRADPSTYQSGGTELPCYELTIEMSI